MKILQIKKNYLFFLCSSLLLGSLTAENSDASNYGIQIAYGTGKPDQLKGYRLAVQKFWPWKGFSQSPLNLTGYWDLSYANWYTSPPLPNQPRSLSIVALSPVIRLQGRNGWLAHTYLELGIGTSWLSNNHLGHRNLGSQFAFQDLIGLGLHWRFNETVKGTLSYHYLHYSNASLFPPNQGIDVKHLLTLGYEF